MNESLQPALQLALEASLDYYGTLDQKPVSPPVELNSLRARIGKPLEEFGLDPETVVKELVLDATPALVGTAGGRFFAWAIGGCVPAALAADWLTSAWDQNAGLYAASPAASVIEEVAGDWLKDLLRLPPTASVAFVTGCQMAHVTCLAAARHSLLKDRGWDVEQNGLASSPPFQVLASNRHGSIERAVRLLGIGAGNIVDLELDADARLNPDSLRRALVSARGVPTIVVLQAGDLNSGSFDDYRTVIPIAKDAGAWVHIDGAFGLWVNASPNHRHYLDGVETADSWATDGHKWLNVPYDCGYAFVAKPDAHRAAMSHLAPYLVYDNDARDQLDWNPEWSRRARGFPTYAAIRQLGRSGIASLVDRCCRHARALVDGIASLPNVEVIWYPHINQGLVRFRDAAGNDRTDRIAQRVVEQGEAFFMCTTWRNVRAMRISVLNWQTTSRDIERAIEAVAKALRE